MKILNFKKIVMVLGFFTFGVYALALEKLPLDRINTDAMTTESQITPDGVGENSMALVWWIPSVFWQSVMVKDTTTPQAQKDEMVKVLSKYSLMAVVQAEISTFGTFDFYSMEEIKENLKVSFNNGKENDIEPIEDIPMELQIILSVFKPILAGAMGNMGNNMHFFVYANEDKKLNKILDPYEEGLIRVWIEKRDKTKLNADIKMPFNSLYVPRKCPNGNDAHISWKYCPWSGEKLPE